MSGRRDVIAAAAAVTKQEVSVDACALAAARAATHRALLPAPLRSTQSHSTQVSPTQVMRVALK